MPCLRVSLQILYSSIFAALYQVPTSVTNSSAARCPLPAAPRLLRRRNPRIHRSRDSPARSHAAIPRVELKVDVLAEGDAQQQSGVVRLVETSMASAAASVTRLRVSGARALCWALKASQPSLSVVASRAPYRYRHSRDPVRRHLTSSATPPPLSSSNPTDAAAMEDAERGLRILRDRAEALEQGGKYSGAAL